MIKQQINIKILITDRQMILPSDKGKTDAQFNQEFFRMFYQFCFQLTFIKRFGQRQKIKNIRVFQGLTGKVGLRIWKSRSEIGCGTPLTLMNLVFNHKPQSIPAPSFWIICTIYQKRTEISFIFCISRIL